MPDNEQSDIDFQPKTKEYSYSTKATTSKKYGIYLLVGIVLLVIILLSALLYLNVLGNNKSVTEQFNYGKKNTQSVLPTKNSGFKTYTELANQATDNQMKSYLDLISKRQIPLGDPEFTDEIYGIFSGFDNQYIQIVTYKGVKNLSYKSNLDISKPEKIEKSATSSGATIGFSKVDNNSFFSKNMFGKILHMKITPSFPETILQIYLTE